jgi:tetratricopeptide (TPR) repeat protein
MGELCTMGREVVNFQDIAAQLDNWSISIRLEKKDAATNIYEQLEQRVNEYDDRTRLDYMLLESRYHLMNLELSRSKKRLEEAKESSEIFTDKSQYYFFFVEAMICHYNKHYQEAIESFEKAGKFLRQLDDQLEVGEFHLRKAMTYHYLDITTLSAIHAERAVEVLKPHKTFEFLLARSEMLQGLNYGELLEFDLAEEYLHRALNSFKNLDNHNFICYINLNLGDLYVKRDLPGTAIRYLEAALEGKPERGRLKILYLLADCYWKTNQPSKAMEVYTQGFQASIEEDNVTKKWEFAMLHKKYEDRVNFEGVWQEGIEYFQRVKDFYNVRLFSKELAQYYTERKQYELASKYYMLAII